MASEAVLQGRIRHVSAGVRQVITFREATVGHAAIIAMLNADVQAIHAVGLPELFKAPAMSDELVAEFATRLLQPENLFLIAVVEDVPAGYLFAEFQ